MKPRYFTLLWCLLLLGATPNLLAQQEKLPTLSVDEPGAYGLLLLTDEGVIVHSADFTLPARAPLLHH